MQDTLNIAMSDNGISVKELHFDGDLIDRVGPDDCNGASFYEFYLKTDN